MVPSPGPEVIPRDAASQVSTKPTHRISVCECQEPALPRARTLLAVAVSLLPVASHAQDAAPADTPSLLVELNGADTVEGACRLSFLVENRLGADLSSLAFETVVLTKAGKVAMLTLFDFRDLPAARPRVRQFDLAGQGCDGIGRILINGASACEGEGIAPGACIDALRLKSLTEQELIG